MKLRLFQIIKNMGLRYTLFRIGYALRQYSGWLIIQFPGHVDERKYISVDAWRGMPVQYMPFSNIKYHPDDRLLRSLKVRVDRIKSGEILYFSSEWIPVVDWHTNPKTRYRYSKSIHWSKIKTMDLKAGDIKYLWELSRFTFVYDLIRYDHYSGENQAEFIWSKIENWIDNNPVNCGPNWICSQEISLRIMNWTFALQYYKHSHHLTSVRFDKIINSIQLQMQHVADNISFSGIAVRNNHILTESLGLYLTGLLYSFFAESTKWKQIGRKLFEEEITYQIDKNGAFIQSSFNYQRVVIQLLSLAIKVAELNKEYWSDEVYRKAKSSVLFLQAFQDQNSGWLPNYGNNDGALFFPLTECHFRDYRPQLEALAGLLGVDSGYGIGDWNEESFWLGNPARAKIKSIPAGENHSFSLSGYHRLREGGSLTFIRSASYLHRPFQCDNLHLDIWVDGENILRDAGTYSYNTSDITNHFFEGIQSHNTVMPGNYDQMEKGPGFIWYNWIRHSEGGWKEYDTYVEFEGWFEGFHELGKKVIHSRKLRKQKDQLYWQVRDMLENVPDDLVMSQIWNPSPAFLEKFTITAFDGDHVPLIPETMSGWYAESYGKKEETSRIIFRTKGRLITTIIKAKSST
jgi:hypothetical protein